MPHTNCLRSHILPPQYQLEPSAERWRLSDQYDGFVQSHPAPKPVYSLHLNIQRQQRLQQSRQLYLSELHR